MNPLNWIGSLFVYTSPDPLDGYRHFLRYKTSKELQSAPQVGMKGTKKA